jgi:hypothetical protein
MSGRRSKESRQQAALGYAIGLDDMLANLDWRQKWYDYNEQVKEARKESMEKGGLVSFLRTAVFYVSAALTAGGTLPLWAQAGIGIGAGATGGMAADAAYGDIKVPEKPELKQTKFNKARQIEREVQLAEAYTTLASDIKGTEMGIDQGHITEPMKNALTWFGPKIAESGFGFKPIDTGEFDYSASGDFVPEATEWTPMSVSGTSGAEGTSGETPAHLSTNIDWQQIRETMKTIAPSVDDLSRNIAEAGTEVLGKADFVGDYSVAVEDYFDYIDDISGEFG